MIKLNVPYFDDDEIKEIKDVLDSGWVAGQGPVSKLLSEKVSSYIGIKHAIPLNNCTAALHLSLLALGVGEGDDVLVSDYTFPATGHAVLFCKARPIFIDVNENTYNMDVADLEKKITPKTKAIIVVHTFGNVANMDEIMDFARKRSIPVIEDAACAFGSEYKQKKAGTIADIGCFSFHGRKGITCGEGGMVVTNNDAYAEKIKSLSCFGMKSAYERQKTNEIQIPTFVELGYNYKLSDINAAILLAQLKKVNNIIERKQTLAKLYDSLLSSVDTVVPQKTTENTKHCYQSYVVTLKNTAIDRNTVIMHLREQGIQAQIGTYASCLQPVYQNANKCENSIELFNNTIALPLYFELEKKDVRDIVDKLISILSQ
jgi:perosamine synthetase